jgi:hypothetical protein
LHTEWQRWWRGHCANDFVFFFLFIFSNRFIFSSRCFCERHPSQTLVFSPRGVWATIVNLLYLIHLQDVRPPPSIPALLSVCVGLARATSCKGLSDLDDERFVWLMRLSRCIKTWWSSSHVWFCVSVSSLNGSGSRRGGPPIEHQFGWQWRPLKLLRFNVYPCNLLLGIWTGRVRFSLSAHSLTNLNLIFIFSCTVYYWVEFKAYKDVL